MTVFFNLKLMEDICENSSVNLLDVLKYHHLKKLPYNRYSKLRNLNISLQGSSFIINPEALFNDSKTDILHKIQYIKLAAKRDYMLYKQYGYKGLQLSFYPDINNEAIKHNPLLKITQTEILFKYEEN